MQPIDPDLLDKYFSGKCSHDEESTVRKWLTRPVRNEQELLAETWNTINRKTINKQKPVRITIWLRYAAAACLLLAGWFVPDFLVKPGQHYSIKNTSHSTYRNYKLAGLDFKLPPSGEARFERGAHKTTVAFMLCGNTEIKNTGESDIDIVLNTSCNMPESVSYPLVCKKGKSYLALQFHYKSEEMVLVDTDRIYDLPLRLQGKAHQFMGI